MEKILENLKNVIVLIVEDDEEARLAIERPLRRRCKAVYSAGDGEQGLQLYREKRPHIIITDIALPKLSGLEMAREIRYLSREVAIIIITAFGNEENLIHSYDLGACSLLKKPIDLDELFMILLANARHSLQKELLWLDNGFSYHRINHTLLHHQTPIKLTKKERQILQLLVKNQGNLVSYAEFQGQIWGNATMTLDALRMHINSIRKKSFQGIIKNLSGIGYQLGQVKSD